MQKQSPDKNEIISEIRRTANDLGRTPSRSAFVAHTGINEYKVLKYFPNWNSAVSAAGLKSQMNSEGRQPYPKGFLSSRESALDFYRRFGFVERLTVMQLQ